MKNNELRMGNLVYMADENNTELLLQIDLFTFVRIHERFRDLKPDLKLIGIPLTEEWLLKFGFNKTYAKDCFEILFLDTLHRIYITLGIENILTIGDNYTAKEYLMVFTKPVVQYVHQLQNLYFALTGKELEIK